MKSVFYYTLNVIDTDQIFRLPTKTSTLDASVVLVLNVKQKSVVCV